METLRRGPRAGSTGVGPLLPGVWLRLMKSKQLANVLIKVLGLSVGVRAIPGFISGIL